jgi:hypothetical protein
VRVEHQPHLRSHRVLEVVVVRRREVAHHDLDVLDVDAELVAISSGLMAMSGC